MNEQQNGGRSRRSRKYHDSSNFGYTEHDMPAARNENSGRVPREGLRIETDRDPGYGYTAATSDRVPDSKRVNHSRSSATASRTERPESKSKVVIGWIISITIAVAVALLVRAYIFEIILVDGESMLPTLHTNERVAVEKVSRYFGMPERGDIIIVTYPDMDGTYVKRAIGLPGETVEIKNSTVYIDGVALEEDYINKDEPYVDMEPYTVREDHVFVMGDNRAHSLDSRMYYIRDLPHDAIVGHGFAIIWPLSEMRTIS